MYFATGMSWMCFRVWSLFFVLLLGKYRCDSHAAQVKSRIGGTFPSPFVFMINFVSHPHIYMAFFRQKWWWRWWQWRRWWWLWWYVHLACSCWLGSRCAMSRPSPVGYCQCTAPMNRVTGFILVYICINSGRRDANLHAFPPSLPLKNLSPCWCVMMGLANLVRFPNILLLVEESD